jgi:putative membrane-bound dehydrogenase-like protein
MIRRAVLLAVLDIALITTSATADKPTPTAPVVPAGYHRVTLGKHTFTLPVGFTIELVAESPQVDRPITAAFDDQGRLFVADSSGSNAKPADQLKDPTHRVVMLESTKKDGKFDKSTVFADKLSFLQGTMWRDGSLYVATPPTIQKLTDTDGDGKADKREVWFDGGVLTGCANDVHGPYPGPDDGRIYFTKGAFAKQELTLGNGKKFVTRAAHIYSAKPDGTDLRVEMTGGMDNPVDVAFNTVGEMFFTTTFFQHPANGKRDGIVHNTYGAVYGKDHDPVHEHVRTRPELSEPMTHLGPAAPSGLHCYHGSAFGDEYRDNLFACQFNLAKVSRHVLKPFGSTYRTEDSDFVVSDNRDFHPTDVIADADGSLLIVDTGGWYKLCCPSSVMEKKDVLGGIYRVRKTNATGNVRFDYRVPVKLPVYFDPRDAYQCRLVAKSLGRSGDPRQIPLVLAAVANEKNDAILDTALTRALIDIGDAKATAEGLKDQSPRVKRAALAALDQMPGGHLKADDVIPHLSARDAGLCETAWWIAGRHPDWGDKLVGYFREQLKRNGGSPELTVRLAKFAGGEAVQKLLADSLADPQTEFTAVTAMLLARPKALPATWKDPLADALTRKHAPLAFAALKAMNVSAADYTAITERAARTLVAASRTWDDSETLHFLASAPISAVAPTDEQFALAVKRVRESGTLSATASLARDALVRSKLTADQLEHLAAALPEVSPVYVPDLLAAFTRTADEKVGVALVSALRTQKLRAVVRLDQVKPIFDKYPTAVREVAAKLYADLAEATKEQRTKLDTILTNTQPGDVRRGHQVFGSAKAACVSCHKVHYVGGLVGPDLTKIGSIRSERDLLESIVFPSASFVRSYEPVKVQTKDGRTFNGILKKDAPDEIVLTVNATDEVQLNRKDIDETTPGTVSIMPTGLDQQLTPQELADLVAFLKSLK